MSVFRFSSKHWLVTQVLPIIASALIGYLIAHLFEERKEPSYAESNSYPYLTQRPDADLNVTWKGRPIKQAFLLYVQIWNAGNKGIEYTDIPSQSPLVLRPDYPVTILSAQAAEHQPRLGLKPRIEHDGVSISWNADEEIRSDNGGVIRILYEADKPTTFRLTGRIKGSTSGYFKYLRAKPELNYPEAWIIFIPIGLASISGIWLMAKPAWGARGTWNAVTKYKTEQEYVESQKKWAIRLVGVLFIVLVVMFLAFVVPVATGLPTWGSTIVHSPSAFR